MGEGRSGPKRTSDGGRAGPSESGADDHPPPEEAAGEGASEPGAEVRPILDRALSLVEFLRRECPWDRAQTARSLVPHLLEESQEVAEAIFHGTPEDRRTELGDLLLNVAFQIVVAEEEGAFDRDEVVRVLEEKMRRRHPHLFGGERVAWEVIKAQERRSRQDADPTGVLDGLVSGLGPLLRAHRIQERVSGVGFDWDDVQGALAKVREELEEVDQAIEVGQTEQVEEELGDLLFAMVNVTRLAGLHAAVLLEGANAKFRRRFERLEALARERGVALGEASLEALDVLWDEAKEEEKRAMTSREEDS